MQQCRELKLLVLPTHVSSSPKSEKRCYNCLNVHDFLPNQQFEISHFYQKITLLHSLFPVLNTDKWPPRCLFPAATELKHSLNVKKMASLVSVSNAFHGFTLNQDGTNTILLPRFTSKPILYTKHANKLTKFHPTT